MSRYEEDKVYLEAFSRLPTNMEYRHRIKPYFWSLMKSHLHDSPKNASSSNTCVSTRRLHTRASSLHGTPGDRGRPGSGAMAEDSGAILRHISSLKDMLDKVNEEIEHNIQKTREIESEIVKHSETEKEYLMKESELMKGVSVAEFELNGLIQVAAAETDSLEVMEGNVEFQKATLNGIRKKISDKMENFISECKGFQANMVGDLKEDLVLLLKEKSSLEDESENLKMKIETIQSSSTEYIADILEEINVESSVLESDLQYRISEFKDILKDINHLKILFSSSGS